MGDRLFPAASTTVAMVLTTLGESTAVEGAVVVVALPGG